MAKLDKAAKLTEQYRGQEAVCVVTGRSVPTHPEFKLTKQQHTLFVDYIYPTLL